MEKEKIIRKLREEKDKQKDVNLRNLINKITKKIKQIIVKKLEKIEGKIRENKER